MLFTTIGNPIAHLSHKHRAQASGFALFTWYTQVGIGHSRRIEGLAVVGDGDTELLVSNMGCQRDLCRTAIVDNVSYGLLYHQTQPSCSIGVEPDSICQSFHVCCHTWIFL